MTSDIGSIVDFVIAFDVDIGPVLLEDVGWNDCVVSDAREE